MTTTNITNGQTSVGLVINDGDILNVSSGGTAISTTVNSGGSAFVFSGGVVSTTTINDGGSETVSSGGTDVSTTIASTGFETVSSGGTANFTTVSGVQSVESDGIASSATIGNNGVQDVFGGTAFDTTIASGGSQGVEGSFAVASGTVVQNGGTQVVLFGGTTVGTDVQSGGEQDVFFATVSNTTVENTGLEVVSNATAIDTTVMSNGVLQAAAGLFGFALISGATISFGGFELVSQGAFDLSATVMGDQIVYGAVSGAVVESGGYEQILNGQSTDVVISNGGTQLDEGFDGGALIESGGYQEVANFGEADFTEIGSGGEQDVLYFGSAFEPLIDSGGFEYVALHGAVYFPLISGGVLEVGPNGKVSGGIGFAGQDGALIVGGSAVPFATISGFAPSDVVVLSGVPFDSAGTVTLGANNVLTVSEGGQTYKLHLDPSQNFKGVHFTLLPDTFYSGTDIVDGPIVSSGQTVRVGNGQTEYNAYVLPGGTVKVASGGTALDTRLSGLEQVQSGGVASGTVVFGGGVEQVQAGGTAVNTQIGSGGTEVVSGNGTLIDPVINGGFLLLQSGGMVSGTIDFDNQPGGDMLIQGLTMPTNTISGLTGGDSIDLPALHPAGVGSATFGANNLLTLTHGGVSVQLQLDPNQSFAGDAFQLLGDGQNGTLFRDLGGGPSGGITVTAATSDTVYLGPNDTLTGGNHTTVIAAPNDVIQGGKADTVDLSQLTAGTGGALVESTGGAPITDTVIGFTEGVDHLSYPGANAGNEASVIASAKVKNGNTTLTFPDHSTVTLVGVTHVDTGIFA